MNHSRPHYHYLLAIICLALLSVIQLGCRSETSESKIAELAKAAPESKIAELPATEPFAKTEVDAEPAPEFVNANFEAPFRLMVAGAPLNTVARQMYPSPAMYDVDNDGQTELIVGDIFGSLNVYENQNPDAGDPVWSKHYALKTADGESIKVSNW